MKVVRTRVKLVLINPKTEEAILCSLPWTHVVNFEFKRDTIL